MPGPTPKHPSERRRRNAAPAMTQLPAEGRQGPTPDWPISGGTKTEKAVWAELWETPQAVMWERHGWFRTVARYCRQLVEAEKRNASTRLLAEVRQMEDRLGLTAMSMKRLGWEIVEDELGQAREEKGSDPRARLRAVDPAAAAGSE